ncbi:UDP-3-O-acyl-N-acetylglucosamine deacetylase [Roseibium aquae]|uniref:UDP-3-O-acyl-N-acetylglucosamine deacetylase n=1 Tax=Roseibium aquae TaxID=1323746 RepID=A0A916WVX6_9HYPH|nr:UDP-3-O-acyl-N-acetylglucosamine deacetylase [Roseibium aquae]GGB36745.1 UDP-3-O-acyl-N-acetylglucosamine deacetylase [Roseibium aquae]
MTTQIDRQTTISQQITLQGIGVHSGKPATLTLLPAEAGVGIVFQRTDKDGSPLIPALWSRVTATSLCTVLGDPANHGVSTVEHLMAALAGMGVDNVIAELDGPEMPIMDGSSAGFVQAIADAGLRRLDRGRRYLKIKRKVRVDNGGAWCELVPNDRTRFDITIDFETPVIGKQRFAADLTPAMFEKDLARARTFGSVQDVEKLWSMGFALGSSLENSVALSEGKVLNPEGTRWPDEFARHKALDAVGDLALAGLPIIGTYRSYKGGHRMNHAILEKLFEDRSAYDIIEAPVFRNAGQAAPGLAAAAFGPETN